MDAGGGLTLEPLVGERALGEQQDIVGHVDHGLAVLVQMAEGPGVRVRPDDDRLLAPDDAHGREMRLPLLVERRDHRLQYHDDPGYASARTSCSRSWCWPSFPP